MTKSELTRLFEAGEREGGVCLNCDERADGVEPDAKRYLCDNCGENRLYGLEYLFLVYLPL